MGEPWAAGWPRKFMEFTERAMPGRARKTKRLPALFLGGDKQAKNDWLNFDDAAIEACKDGACAVCGEPLNRLVVFGAVDPFESNGPPVHPRCFALTLKFCPHFQRPHWQDRRRPVAYIYEGDDHREVVKPTGRVAYEVSQVNPDVDTSDPRFLLGSQYGLKRGTVKPFKRAACLDLAKSDPLGLAA